MDSRMIVAILIIAGMLLSIGIILMLPRTKTDYITYVRENEVIVHFKPTWIGKQLGTPRRDKTYHHDYSRFLVGGEWVWHDKESGVKVGRKPELDAFLLQHKWNKKS